MSELHLEILPSVQQAGWHQLQEQADFLKDHNFYLAGGTALALQAGHRQSVDFDFFSPQKNTGPKTFAWLQTLSDFVVRDMDENTVHGQLGQVKASFIGGYKYPLVADTVLAGKLSLASIPDIGLMKLLAITHRATVRDYLDLAIIIRDHIKLPRLLEMSRSKYGDNFNILVPLRALTSFTDLDPEHPKLFDKSLASSWQLILRKAVKELANE